MINYLVKKEDIVKIFADFYYVKNKNELEAQDFKEKHSLIDLVSKLLKLLNIGEWYFGLHTALRFHGISLKENPAECLICSRMPFNGKKIEVLEKKLQVFIFKPELIDFYITKNGIKFSDLEKTFLDFLYLWKLNNIPDHKLFRVLGKYRDRISEEKIKEHSKNYPLDIQKILNEFYS